MAAGAKRDLIELPQAVSEIHQACAEGSAEPGRSPFFFVVGAGISSPPVPLASQIIEHCRSVAKEYERATGDDNTTGLDLYSYWFELAYPQPRLRQVYLRRLIDKRPISQANLRLAHLLISRKVTNLVVTTNFDDFLTRALYLLGEGPVICDHPSTVGRIALDSSDIQVLHVHGSYHFYDLANLHGEVTGRAETDTRSSLTPLGLLDNVLWNRSPLVVGYSGWEGDVVMTALRRRIQGGQPLGQQVYWFCYSRDQVDKLPDFLRSSGQVRFVVAPAIQPAAPTGGTMQGEQRLLPEVLSAREVFDALIRRFALGLPPILSDPLSYFASYVEKVLSPEEDAAGLAARMRAITSAIRS